MTSLRPRFLALFAIISLSLAVPAIASPGGKKERQQKMEKRHAERAAKVEQAVRTQLAPALKLDDGQTDRLLESMRETHLERKAARKRVKLERKKLKKLLKHGAGDGPLSEQLANLRRAQEEMPSRHALLDDTARYLSMSQRAQLTIMLPKIMKHGKKHRRAHRQNKQRKRGE